MVRHNETTQTVRAHWIARKEGWWRQNTEHPTAAAWSRWKGVKDWDSYELAEKYPRWASAVCGIRGTATNHVERKNIVFSDNNLKRPVWTSPPFRSLLIGA